MFGFTRAAYPYHTTGRDQVHDTDVSVLGGKARTNSSKVLLCFWNMSVQQIWAYWLVSSSLIGGTGLCRWVGNLEIDLCSRLVRLDPIHQHHTA